MVIAAVRVVLLVVVVVLLPAVASARSSAPAVTAPAVAPERPGVLTVTPRTPIRGEWVRVGGRLPTRGVRPVRLQRQARAGWTTVARARTARDGTYQLATRATWPASARLRVASASYRTPVRIVRTQPQRTIARTPATGRVGRATSIAARAFPARPGRAMVLERRGPSGWRGVATARQDRAGRAAFDVEPAAPGIERYRVVARPHAGAGAATSTDALLRVAADEVVIDERVVVLSAAEAAALRDPDAAVFPAQPTRLVFANLPSPLALHALRPGQVISVPPSAATPRGSLLEITAREVGALDSTLEVSVASLSDVVVNVPDDQSGIRLHPIGPPAATRHDPGVRPLPARPGDRDETLRFALDVRTGQNPDHGPPTARTVGSISLEPVVSLAYDVDEGVVDRYEVGLGWRVDDTLRTTIRPSAYGTGPVGGAPRLVDVDASYVGMIGRLPVWVTLSGSTTVRVAAEGQYGMDSPVAVVATRREGAVTATYGSDGPDARPDARATTPEVASEITEAGTGRAAVEAATESVVTINGEHSGSYESASRLTSLVDVAVPGPCSVVRTRGGVLQAWRWHMLLGHPGWVVLTSPATAGEDAGTTCPPDPALRVLSERLPDVVVGEEYASALETVDHRAGSWEIADGDLPAGLVLTDDGRIRGTYVGPPIERTVTVRFTDEEDAVVSAAVQLRSVASRSGSRWATIDGGRTSCGIQADGSGWCWGDNSRGQVGTGDFEPRPRPVRLDGDWQTLTAGATTCGVRTDETGWCWGENLHGQVGDGTTVDRPSPVQLPGRWQEIRPGAVTCGVMTDGTGWCWGNNEYGQLGDGTNLDRSSPSRLDGSWRSIVPGHSVCGIQSDDSAWCWGPSYTGNDPASGSRPTRLAQTWRTVAGAWDYAVNLCGIRANGLGWCATAHTDGPARVTGDLHSFTVVDGTSCAIRVDRSAACWGANHHGQVGNGSTSETEDDAVDLVGSWRSLQTGVRTCGVRVDDSAWCWGFNGYGGVGDGTSARRRTSPVRIPGSWSQLDDSCGIRTDGTAWCWGTSGLGPVATGETDFRTTPIQVP